MKKLAPLAALLLAGCMTMEPAYDRPDPAVPASWPVGDAYLRRSEAELPAVTYRELFRDPRLQSLIEQGLDGNRDLAAAAANIAAARARYRIQRAELFPEIDARVGVTGSEADGGGTSADFTAGVGVPSFELDLFGRIRSLSKSQQNLYFASEAATRATRLALVADIADAWLTYGADASLLAIAEDTAASAQRSVSLTRARLEGGIAPRTDLRQAELVLRGAEASVARQRTALAQDINLLQLLVGAPIDPGLLPASIEQAAPTVHPLPAGVSSLVLLRRPDVMQAEFQLRAANAEIGAARAALFPSISLTGLLGIASSSLTGLFSGGSFGWNASADATYSIFRAGAGVANVRLNEAERDAAVANYQKAIQTAFREVSDALARQGTAGDELRAREAQRASAADNYRLSEARYRAGIDNFLLTLDSQRTYFAAQQTLVQMRLESATNLVDLYRALGGDSLYPPEAPNLTTR
jgi:multidrug efflux system outer membrane protein